MAHDDLTIKTLGFIADTALSRSHALLDAMYCASRVGNSIEQINVYHMQGGPAGVTSLTEIHLSLLADYGVTPEALVRHCQGRFHYADLISTLSSPSGWCSPATLGVPISGIDFHHFLTVVRLAGGVDETLASYSLNNACEAANLQMTKTSDPRNIRSSLTMVLNVDSQLLCELIERTLERESAYSVRRACISMCPVTSLNPIPFRPVDPPFYVATKEWMRAIDESQHSADFFFDYSFHSADAQTTSDTLKLTILDASLTDTTAVRSAVVVGQTFLARVIKAKSRLCVYLLTKEHTLRDEQASNDIIVEIAKRLSIEPKLLSAHVSVHTAPINQHYLVSHTGNCLRIGKFLQWSSLATINSQSATQDIIENWLQNFPRLDTLNVIQPLAEQRLQMLWQHLAAFALLPLIGQQVEHPIVGHLGAQHTLITDLRRRLELFLANGSIRQSEADLIGRNLWFNLMLACQLWPTDYDVVTDTVDGIPLLVDKLAAKVAQATQQHPIDYVTREGTAYAASNQYTTK